MKSDEWLEVSNVIFNPAHVQYIMHDEEDSRIVYMRFADGFILTFMGDEAIELWHQCSEDKGWRPEDQ